MRTSLMDKAWMVDVQKALQEIAPSYSSDLGIQHIYFHPLYRVGVTKNAGPNLNLVFGSSWFGKLRSSLRNLRKLDWIQYAFQSLELTIPKDSIIFFKPERKRIVLVSHERKIVIKISISKERYSLVEEEVKLLQSIKSSHSIPYAPSILGHGITSEGASWIATSFCSNSNSLQSRFSPEKYFLDHFVELILPSMTEFYQGQGAKSTSMKDWLKKTELELEAHPSQAVLKKLITHLKADKLYDENHEILEGQIHFDLHAGNIMMENNHASIIDWEVAQKGLVLIDIFDSYRRLLKSCGLENLLFWLYMKQIVRTPPKNLSLIFGPYQSWSKTNFSSTTTTSPRVTLLIYTIERALIYHRKWGTDRFKDKSGFEAKVARSL